MPATLHRPTGVVCFHEGKGWRAEVRWWYPLPHIMERHEVVLGKKFRASEAEARKDCERLFKRTVRERTHGTGTKIKGPTLPRLPVGREMLNRL